MSIDRLALFPNDKRMRPNRSGYVVIPDEERRGTRIVEMNWGLRNRNGGHPWSLIRSEGRRFDPFRRCIALLDAFYVEGKEPGTLGRWRVRPTSGEAGFAGIWRRAEDGWPASYAVLTVEAGPDLRPYEPRQNVVLWIDDWADWLAGRRPEEEMLTPPPAGSLTIDRVGRAARKASPRSGGSREGGDNLFGW